MMNLETAIEIIQAHNNFVCAQDGTNYVDVATVKRPDDIRLHCSDKEAYAKFCVDNGTVKYHKTTGGGGEGDYFQEVWEIFHPVHGTGYVAWDGLYDSWNGVEWDWTGIYLSEPVQVTYTEFHKVK